MSFWEKRKTGPEKIFELVQYINEQRISPIENNYKLIKADAEEDLGKYVIDWNIRGILVGAIADDDDYYYLIMDKDRKLHYSSCVGKYKLMADGEASNDFSVLNWMRENDSESLMEIIDECIKRNQVVPISKIGVNPIKKKN